MKFLINFILSFLLISQPVFATLNEVDKSSGVHRNILNNPGFELGKTYWTASGGTFALVNSGSNLLFGTNSATWDSSATSQTLTATAVTIPKGSYGKNGMAYCSVQTPSGTATHKIQVYDGTNVLSEKVITSNTSPVKDILNFIIPSTGSISLRYISVASNEPLIVLDDCFLGEASDVGTINDQASLVASGYFDTTASCASWTRANAALGAFAADTDCPGPTIGLNPGPGTLQTTDVDLPKFTINSLPPGNYKITWIFGILLNGAANNVYATNDGTTTVQGGSNASNTNGSVTVISTFNYTTTANRTFELYAASPTNTITLDISTNLRRVMFFVERFPSTTSTFYSADVLANSWSGYHDNTCSWARTNTAYGDPTADASCVLVERTNQNFGTVSTSGSVLPAITFTPKRAGRYYVKASLKMAGGTLASHMDFRLWDGTTVVAEEQEDTAVATDIESVTLSGNYVAASTAPVTLSIQDKASSGSVTIAANGATNASAIEWTVIAIDQALPAPVLVNSIVSKANNVVGNEVAEISCTAASSLTQNPGLWLSSIGNRSTATCALTIAAGVFSATPYYCGVTTKAAAVQATACSCSSSTACSVVGASADYSAYVNIVGPR